MIDENRYRIRDKRRNAYMNIDIYDHSIIYWHKTIGKIFKYEMAEKIVATNSHYIMEEV